MPTETLPSFEALLSLGLYTAIAVFLVGMLMLNMGFYLPRLIATGR